MYTILNEKNGVAIVTNEHGELYVYTNGKYYGTRDFRPVDGEGRQLREDTRNIVSELLPAAQEQTTVYLNRREAAIATAYEDGKAEGAKTPTKSFADALQDAFLSTLTEKAAGGMVDMIYPQVEEMIKNRFGAVPVVHEIKVPDRKPFETTEILHKDFDAIISMVMDGEPVYLCGPAGTGKSYLAQQVAKALNLDYWYTNSVTDDIQIKGFIDANGRYHETQFYQAFTQGGLFLLDELDASVPETLVLLNNALANGYFDFPNGKAVAHPDFRCMAAGNTYGTGADSMYTGRYQLDASSMDRFALIMVDYDERIETAMARGDKFLVEFAHAFREATEKAGITCLCTYRAIKRLAKFSCYMDKAQALRIGLLKGLSADDVELINRQIRYTGEWSKALDSLVK